MLVQRVLLCASGTCSTVPDQSGASGNAVIKVPQSHAWHNACRNCGFIKVDSFIESRNHLFPH